MDRVEHERLPRAFRDCHRGHPEARLAGVCAGLAACFDIPLTLVRAGFLLGALLGPSTLLVVGAYAVLWFLMPPEPGAASGLDQLAEGVEDLVGNLRRPRGPSELDAER